MGFLVASFCTVVGMVVKALKTTCGFVSVRFMVCWRLLLWGRVVPTGLMAVERCLMGV